MSVRVPLSSQKSNELLKQTFRKSLLPSTSPNISDLEFLVELAELGSLVIEEGAITTTGDMVTITPDTGTTFFYLGAVVQNTDTLEGVARIINNGTVREAITLQANEIYEFKIPLDRIVGNMSGTFQLRGITVDISMQGTLYGWTENTKKIQ